MQRVARLLALSILLSTSQCPGVSAQSEAKDASKTTPAASSNNAPSAAANHTASPKPDTIQFAQAQINRKDFKGALLTYKTIYLARPFDADVLLGMAYCCEQLGQLDQAITYGKQAVVADPKSPETHIALAHYHEKNRDLKEAYLQYDRAMDLKPSSEVQQTMFVPMLRLLMNLNNIEIACRKAQEWAKQFPKDANCQYNKGWMLSQSGDEKKLPDAVAAYEKALLLDPNLTATHYNLALLHLKMGDREKTQTSLESFIKLAPKDPDVSQAKVLLAKLKQGALISPAPKATDD